jgi:type IV pilus assembly protein PilO
MNLGEFNGSKLVGGLVLGALVVTAALYFTVFKSQREDNAAAQTKLNALLQKNAELEAYQPRLAELDRQVASLKEQLEAERHIVPDEKEIDNFMRMVNGEARKAGVEMRRYTSRPYATKEFYTEVPFEVELDGSYYSMLGFFDRLTKVERIVNVSGLSVASVRKPSDAHARHSYQYAPGESVVATCLTTTYFSHDLDPAGPAAKAATAATPAKK